MSKKTSYEELTFDQKKELFMQMSKEDLVMFLLKAEKIFQERQDELFAVIDEYKLLIDDYQLLKLPIMQIALDLQATRNSNNLFQKQALEMMQKKHAALSAGRKKGAEKQKKMRAENEQKLIEFMNEHIAKNPKTTNQSLAKKACESQKFSHWKQSTLKQKIAVLRPTLKTQA